MKTRFCTVLPIFALTSLLIACGGDEEPSPNPVDDGKAGGASGASAGGAAGSAAGTAGKGGGGGSAGKGGSSGQGGAGAGGSSGSSGQGGSSGSSGQGGSSGSSGQGGAGQSGAGGGAGQSGAGGDGGASGAGAGGEAGAGQSGAGGEAGVGGAGAGGESGSGGAGGDSGSGGVAGFGLETRPSNTTCVAPARPATGATIALEPFSTLKFSLPILLLQAPGDETRFFVVQKGGVIGTFDGPQDSSASVFLDISSKVNAGPNEAGLLGAAFHPNFKANGQIFVSYTRSSGSPSGLNSVISRFNTTDGGKTIDPTTEKVLLDIPQPYSNHNGGMIAFGPDGYLYVAFGDGGSGGDPQGNGQKLNTLLGKFLRIDVNNGDPYAIPPGNPLNGQTGRPEIFAWGVRNPWRFSFDRATGDLWTGDVGQNAYEEVDVIKVGGNYGWNTMEGFHCFSPASNCDQSGLILPVVEYGHNLGQSITGGFVYRGTAIPELVGRYFYADFVSGRIWAIKDDPATGKPSGELMLEPGFNISSFGEDLQGNLYVLNFGAGTISKIVAATPGQPSNFPTKLSETGCVDPGNPTQVAAGLIPYDVNAPFWSDGAEKKRWIAVPDGKQITVDAASGDMDLPVGSVVVKEFKLGGKRIETRLFVRHDDGGWAGYSYEWNDSETEATYVAGGKKKQIGGQTWLYPSSSQCLQCHTQAAGSTLGLEVAQLNRTLSYPGGASANELSTLEHIGMFTQALSAPAEQLPALPEPFGTDEVGERAKSYLHTNCSFCHRPGGSGGGDADFRFSTPLVDMKICGTAPQHGDFDLANPALLSPGAPNNSIISLRVHSLDSRRMPPLGSSVVDEQGATLLDSYIQSIAACPTP